jgi:phage terminase Nu1 subunit (DNA packaging protein)
MAKQKIDEVTTAQLAKIIGKTTRWVNELTRSGVFVQSARGKYLLAENVQRYIAHIQERNDHESEVNYHKEKAAHERAKRQKAELELQLMKGELHKAEHVELVMNDMVAAFRSKILGLPSKLAPQLVGKTEIPVILDMLTREVHEALAELSEYDPQKFLAVSEDYVEVDDDDPG